MTTTNALLLYRIDDLNLIISSDDLKYACSCISIETIFVNEIVLVECHYKVTKDKQNRVN